MSISRRRLLAGGASLGAMAVLRSAGIREVLAREHRDEGYGPLEPDPRGLLDLPEGFSYRAFGRTGDRMSDGLPTPGAHDGMAAFRGPGGSVVLVRNHELSPSSSDSSGIPLELRYDPGDGGFIRGGTTTLVVGRGNELIASRWSLGGTIRNCAGGPTPWGSWITCEETTITPETDSRATKRHGYAFEVPAGAPGPVEPVPLVAMGRFRHEAVAVDPSTGFVYETEDTGDACFYRFRPRRRGRLEAGGILEAMRLLDFPRGIDTGSDFPVGTEFDVDWVPIANVDPGFDETPVNVQGQEEGAAVIRRGEGIWWSRHDRAFYFVSTSGGNAGSGQIFRFTPGRGRHGNGTFELFLEASGSDTGGSPHGSEWPDNITVAPWGDLILCEDGPGTQYLTMVTGDGEVFRLARNALNDSEFCGATFSPDGEALFVNVQSPGITYAVTGPWRRAHRGGRG